MGIMEPVEPTQDAIGRARRSYFVSRALGWLGDAPRDGLRHVTRYVIYMWRLMVRARATPHQIALGCAIGVFAACTPFLGIQMLLAAVIAFMARANIAASLIATFVGNPLSWPAIWSASYVAGAFVLGVDPAFAADQVKGTAVAIGESLKDPSPANIDAAVVTISPLVRPMVIGSLIVGLTAAIAAYYPTARAVRMLQDRRSAV